MDKQILRRLLERKKDSHKYNYGHILIVGGSPGMVGAPLLSGKAALRIGAGLVTIASSALVTDKLEERVEEIMTLSLPVPPLKATARIEQYVAARKVSVVVIGPGMPVNASAARTVEQLIHSLKLPIIIDGGGLGVLGHKLAELPADDTKTLILTPHFGEFQRVVDQTLPEERKALKPIAMQFAKAHHLTLVLKGHPTYVACPDGSLYENTTGNPGLATAGTGDVLSGMIAGLIGQGLDVYEATEAAVYLHGLAGDIAAAEKTEPGMIASDVIEAIPDALKRSSR